MKNVYYFFIISLFLYASKGYAQLDSLQLLPEVILSDVKLRDFSQGISVQTISDSTALKSTTSLTNLLQQESQIYFRENGPGGVSSASFRGTSAQQTAVVWNGININSQLNGQTDFNTIASRNYDNIQVRSGGGSIPYGSGAVGGSVHLQNDIRFGTRFENDILLSYGSFDTPAGQYKSTYATNNFYIDTAIDYRKSENDFEILETDNRFNENGEFENTNLNLNLGLKLAPSQVLKLYHNTFLGNRNFASTLTAPSDDGFKDRNTRTLVEWAVEKTKFTSKLRFAHIFEQFEFFPNGLQDSISTIGKANRVTANYDFTYRFSKNASLKTIVDYTSVVGEGTNIAQSRRELFSGVLLWNHKVSDKLTYGVQLRQESTSDFDSPLLLGVGGEYAPGGTGRFAKAYKITLNASQNYRIPTFNDIFWQGAGAVGNPDLLPETSTQAELGHKLSFKNLNIGVQTYYINVEDLIVWRPNTQGIWSPINVSNSEHYGAEFTVDYVYSINDHRFSLRGNYAYTEAVNKETGDQLIFVPRQKATGGLAYQLKRWTGFYQFSYTDEVFTTTDNTTSIEGYALSNVGLGYTLLDQNAQKMKIDFRTNNLFNKNYQTVAFRPNPGRNFLIQTTYNF